MDCGSGTVVNPAGTGCVADATVITILFFKIDQSFSKSTFVDDDTNFLNIIGKLSKR